MLPTYRHPHHPWRAFRHLSDWKLHWADLPGNRWGQTCFVTRTVTLATDLNQAERRCTIAHETQHILRGPVAERCPMREELEINRDVAWTLAPDLGRVADALAWARGDFELAADDLWIDDLTLEVRLSALRAGERDYLTGRLADVML